MTIKVENNIPKFFVLGDTKLNTQTFESYLEDNGSKNFSAKWLNQNPDSNKISSSEKFVEYMGRMFSIYEHQEISNSEYLKQVLANPYSHYLLQQANINVLFKNISVNFLFLLLRTQIDGMNLINSKISLEKLGFWLPPSMEQVTQKEAALKFGLACTGLAQKIEELMTFYSYHALEKDSPQVAEKVRANMLRLMPLSTQFYLGVNLNILGWRQLLLKASDFLSEDELRFVFLFLAKEFKSRYYGFFQDCVLEDNQGNTFGLDTLKAEDLAWYKYKLKFKI
jgi:hypothetical protein